MNEHKINQHPVDTQQYRDKKNCDECNFESAGGSSLKKHERDCHDIWDYSKSISPPPKRKKNQNEQHNTNKSNTSGIEVEGLISDMEEMELDETKKLSDIMDKKSP